MRRAGRWLPPSAAVLLIVLLTSCGGGSNDGGTNANGSDSAPGVDETSLEVGDCFNPLPGDAGPTLVGVSALPCDEPHGSQVTGQFDLEGDADGNYPFSTLDADTLGPCAQARSEIVITDDVVVAAEESSGSPSFHVPEPETRGAEVELQGLVSRPSPDSWEEGHRLVTCYISSASGRDITGSVMGASG